ncbi:MAG: DUF1559 domain-containing protein [Planctomycetaceae bacterium]
MNLRTSFLLWGCFGLIALQSRLDSRVASAQDSNSPGMMSSELVPDDAIAVVTASPAELLQSPALELFPIEVFRVQAKEQFGIDPVDLSLVKVVIGFPAHGEPQFGVILQSTRDINLEKLLPAVDADPQAIDVDGHAAHVLTGGPPGAILHAMGARQLYVGMRDYLDPIIKAKNGTGPLPTLLKTMPMKPGINAALAIEPIRPLINAIAAQQAGSLAPALQPLGQLPSLTDAVQLNLGFEAESGQVELTFVGIDTNAAKRIESILKESLNAARELAVAEVQRSMESTQPSDEMRAATLAYAERIGAYVIQMLTPQRTDDRVTLSVESKLGVAGSGILVGLLLPAVQAARVAAQRTTTANHFKQVLLAFHNYHDVHRQLPPPAITDASGKPLLSWRVAILPFVEEQALYEQFHLDEPWNSEHNLPLSKRLPAVYAAQGVKLEPGETVVHAVVGETIGLRPKDRTRFHDFLDGTSNSILVVQTKPDSAVPWSKPEDVTIDLANPLAKLIPSGKNGFYVGMADGSVRFVADNIDAQQFKAMLTRGGGERIAP